MSFIHLGKGCLFNGILCPFLVKDLARPLLQCFLEVRLAFFFCEKRPCGHLCRVETVDCGDESTLNCVAFVESVGVLKTAGALEVVLPALGLPLTFAHLALPVPYSVEHLVFLPSLLVDVLAPVHVVAITFHVGVQK